MNRFEKDLTNAQLIIVAVAELGGVANTVDIEDIAIRAYELAPTRFSWRKYPDKIDLRVVQYALKDACAKKETPLIKGSVKRGYMLTTAGLEWITKQEGDSAALALDGVRRYSLTEKLAFEKVRLLSSRAFQKFKTGKIEQITQSDFEDFVRVNNYFPLHVRKKRYLIVENSIQDETELQKFWEFLKEKFSTEGFTNG